MANPFDELGADDEIGDDEIGDDESGDDESGDDESGGVSVERGRHGNPYRDGVRKRLPFELVFAAAGTQTLRVTPDDAAFWVDTLQVTTAASTCTWTTPMIGTTPVSGAVATEDLNDFAATNNSAVEGNYPTPRGMSPTGGQFVASVTNSAGTTLRGVFYGWASASGVRKNAKKKSRRRAGRARRR